MRAGLSSPTLLIRAPKTRKRVRGFGVGGLIPQNLRPGEDEGIVPFLSRILPGHRIPNGSRHQAVWRWIESLRFGEPAIPRLEIWPRGGAKSDLAEKACVYLACTLKRRFVLYVSGTQDQADLHVRSISALLELAGIPRAVNAYQASLNWTAQRLQTANGFGVIGVGLNVGIRGARLGEFRPDLIILDDVDSDHDSREVTSKKLRTISSAILPAGSPSATVLFIQNRIHRDSCIAQIADGRAELLLGASVFQEPAVLGLEYERVEVDGGVRYRVVGGEATWPEGQSLAVCEKQINEWGLGVFLSESQHEDRPEGGLWDRGRDIDPYRVGAVPVALRRIVIGVDPSGSKGTEAGIVAAGLGTDNRAYVLADLSCAGTTNQWVSAAIAKYHALKADSIIAERNYGGDLVEAAFKSVDNRVLIKMVNATRGKLVRAEPIQQRYERGLVSHVGVFPELEAELCRWQVGQPSPNRMDALVWALTELFLGSGVPFESQEIVRSFLKLPKSNRIEEDDDTGAGGGMWNY